MSKGDRRGGIMGARIDSVGVHRIRESNEITLAGGGAAQPPGND